MQRTVKLVGVAVAAVAIALLAVGAMALWQGRPADVAREQDMTPESGESSPTAAPAATTAPPAPAQSLYQTYDIGEDVGQVTASDLDGDGYPDLAAPDYDGGVLRLFFNEGDGTFQDGVTYSTGEWPIQVVAADLDADSNIDLVVAHSSRWKSAETKLSVLLNEGDGTFGEAVDYAFGYISSVAGADLDGDSDPDLLSVFFTEPAPGERKVGVWLNDGQGAFREGPQYDAGFAPSIWSEGYVGDLDGDSVPDLVLDYNPVGKVTVHLGNGDATFGAPVEYEAGTENNEVFIVDLNRDSYADLAIFTFAGTVHILLNNGDGTFQESVDYEVALGSMLGLVAHVNGDAYPDLLVPDRGRKMVQVLVNNGDGAFQQTEGYPVDFEPGGALVTDLNGDSQPELLVYSDSQARVGRHSVLSVQPLERDD